jgi:hypothetical protein
LSPPPPPPNNKKQREMFSKFPNNELIVHTNPMVNIPQNAGPSENYIAFCSLKFKPTKFLIGNVLKKFPKK